MGKNEQYTCFLCEAKSDEIIALRKSLGAMMAEATRIKNDLRVQKNLLAIHRPEDQAALIARQAAMLDEQAERIQDLSRKVQAKTEFAAAYLEMAERLQDQLSDLQAARAVVG